MSQKIEVPHYDAGAEERIAQIAKDRLGAIVITDDASFARATEMLKVVKDRAKSWDEEKQRILRPMLDVERAIRDHFRPAENLYTDIVKTLKQRIGDYTLKQNARRVEQMQALAPVAPPPVPTKGVSTREVVKWRIEEPEKVPQQYCSPDPTKIQMAIDKGIEVPGVKFYTDTIITVR